jgi:hypothetical protein
MPLPGGRENAAMIALQFDIREDMKKLESFSARRFNQIMKRGLIQMILFWHREYAPRHFTPRARQLYGTPGSRTRTWYMDPETHRWTHGRMATPLVYTGNLRKRVLSDRGRGEIRATSKKASLKMRYGRPGLSDYTPEQINNEAVRLMLDKDISIEQAIARVEADIATGRGYKPQVRKYFQREITKLHTSERTHLMKLLRDFVTRELIRTGPKRQRRIG